MAKYNIGIVGFGKIARDQHAPAIAASEHFQLTAVSNIARGEAPADVAVFPSYREMLSGMPHLDAVALCTPPGPRRAIAVDCLQAGRHVLLEKPPAATVAEVSDIAARATTAGRVLFATYHAQHNRAVEKAAAALAGRTVTKLVVTWKEDIRKWHPGQDWILSEGGFGIFDPGINALSILTRILPQPIFIHSADLLYPANRQAPIAAQLSFAIENQSGQAFTADFDWRWSGSEIWRIDIETSDDTKLKLENGGARLEINGGLLMSGPQDEYPDIYREFAGLLASGTSKADIAPFQLVADSFMIGRRTTVDPFDFSHSEGRPENRSN